MNPVIAATGLYAPPDTVSNDELVESFNAYVEGYNADDAAVIAAGETQALLPSSAEFILKASGIRSRHVIDKAGVLDPERMRPDLPERGDDALSVMAEMALAAANDAPARWGKPASEIDGVICAASNMQRAYPDGVGAPDKLFVQQGRKVFKGVTPMVAAQILDHATELGLDPTGLTRLWLHQANIGMNEMVGRKVLGREPERQENVIILDEFANTASAGSIIAFPQRSHDLADGDVGLICSFGAGYSVGSVFVRKRAQAGETAQAPMELGTAR